MANCNYEVGQVNLQQQSKMIGVQDSLQSILKDLEVLYTQLVSKLSHPQATNNPFSRKSISQLSNKIYPLTQVPNSPKTANQNKEILLHIFRSHLTNYVNNHIINALIRCYDDSLFIQAIVTGWAHFKRFVMTYNALLIHANDFYEKESVNAKKKEPTKEPNILPVPALALNLFSKLIIARYQNRIERIVTQLIQKQRQRQNPEDERLQVILSMLWSCSLRDLGRMTLSKEGNITFWKQRNKNITKEFKQEDDNEKTFLEKHLKFIAGHGALYYSSLYWDKLSHLHAREQVQHLDMICQREEQLSLFQMPSSSASNYYLAQIRKALLVDLQGILTKPKGFKSIFLDCTDHIQQAFPLAMRYFSIFKYVPSGISLICKIMGDSLIEKGNEINSKMNKPRQHITLMLKFKKAVRSIFDTTDNHCLEIELTMEKIFKKLLQSLECTKNLAEYADYSIKQCVRMKLDDDGCENKFRDILFLLMSVSAKDSFLLHYQQYLAKRLIESLNEPRTDIEVLMLKLLGQQLGNLTISHHLGMVKDIEKSVAASERIHSNLPFISYKWDLRVFNPSSWPQSTSRQRFIHLQPPSSIKMHTNIIEDLYLQHFGAKLKMKFEKGTSLFEGRFPCGKVKFQAQNCYLMLLLHLSERKSGVTILQLRKIFSDKKEDFKAAPVYHIVQVLLQNRLLLRNKSEVNVQEDEQIRLNYDYKPAEGFKPQIPIIIKPSQALIKLFKENNIDETKIIKEREKLIDAMLVKLLKHANATKGNSISFTELYDGVKGNSFLANLDIPQSLVKQRLEYLIVKQFCKRNQDDRRIYHYIA